MYVTSNAYGIGAWDHHIELVYKISINICDEYRANYDIVSLAALLHDIASITNKEYTENHHIIGAEIAQEVSSKYDISEEKIELIKKSILNQRGSKLVEKTTPKEVCIADADAMAHFYSAPSLLRMVYVEKICLLMMVLILSITNYKEVIINYQKKVKK